MMPLSEFMPFLRLAHVEVEFEPERELEDMSRALGRSLNRCMPRRMLRSKVRRWADTQLRPMPGVFVAPSRGMFFVGTIDAVSYTEMFGHTPTEEELERINCSQPGTLGHVLCGWCGSCEQPRATCGHLARGGGTADAPVERNHL